MNARVPTRTYLVEPPKILCQNSTEFPKIESTKASDSGPAEDVLVDALEGEAPVVEAPGA